MLLYSILLPTRGDSGVRGGRAGAEALGADGSAFSRAWTPSI